METVIQEAPVSKAMLWSGRIISGLVVLFMVFDGVTKLMKIGPVLEAAARLGYTVGTTVAIGCILLVCTALYVIPQTSVLGAILLTGYLGGAVASNLRIGSPVFNTVFPVIFGMVTWGGIFLRDSRLRTLLPLKN
jgi:hypothetical protein